jgi:hypothetical protein
MIVLSAWRHEIRPRFLDPPAALARAVLGLVGIPGGVAVFTSDLRGLSEEALETICVEVRAVAGEGPARRIYPATGRVCPAPPPRLWVRGEDIALARLRSELRNTAGPRRAGTLPPSLARVPRLLAESMAEHFRGRARAAGHTPDRYALLWTESKVNVASGARRQRILALIRWQADPAGDLFISWSPDEQTLQEHWPALGEP